jgi:hypothetical protein
MTKKKFPRIDVLQKAHGFQLLAPEVEGQEHLVFGLQLLTLKVEVQEHAHLGLQLLALKVEDRKPNALGLQLLMPKVECQELNLTFYTTFFFVSFMSIGLILNLFFIHLV